MQYINCIALQIRWNSTFSSTFMTPFDGGCWTGSICNNSMLNVFILPSIYSNIESPQHRRSRVSSSLSCDKLTCFNIIYWLLLIIYKFKSMFCFNILFDFPVVQWFWRFVMRRISPRVFLPWCPNFHCLNNSINNY